MKKEIPKLRRYISDKGKALKATIKVWDIIIGNYSEEVVYSDKEFMYDKRYIIKVEEISYDEYLEWLKKQRLKLQKNEKR